MHLSEPTQPRAQRIVAAFVGTLIATTLAFGALAINDSVIDDQAKAQKVKGRKLALTIPPTAGGKPIRK